MKQNVKVMCPGVFYRNPHPGGVGPCVHCKTETGSWCPSCLAFVCTVRFTQGDSGCDSLHASTCKGQDRG